MGIDVETINKYIIEEMGLAEENGDKVTIRLNLSDGDCIEIWFDEENDYYTWSNASYGYEDTFSVVGDIIEYLEDRGLEVTDMEVI